MNIYHTTSDSVVFDSLSDLSIPGIMSINEKWIDSDSALVLAGSQGGIEFCSNQTRFEIIVELCKPLVPNSTPRWIIKYVSLDDPSDNLFINLDATENIVDDLGSFEILPIDVVLFQNYPNPFNPSTTIEFDLPKFSEVTLKIFNILGEEVIIVVSDKLTAGSHSYSWDASNMTCGVICTD